MFLVLQAQGRYQKMWVRTQSTVAMIGGFIGFIYMGHVPTTFLIFAIQVWFCWAQHEQLAPSAGACATHLSKTKPSATYRLHAVP